MPVWPTNSQLENVIMVQVENIHDLFRDIDIRDLNWLTDTELARYQSIKMSNRKNQFLVGHYLIRKLASELSGNSFGDWEYFLATKGQRQLKCGLPGTEEFYCSISHSGEWIAAAISPTPVGIDIETFGKARDFLAIADHVFSTAEVDQLKECDPKELKQQFYLHWTLKESVAKQFGIGLKFEVSRSHIPKPITDLAVAEIHSWLCKDYVLSLACCTPNTIETRGLSKQRKHQAWINIGVGD
jgi:4'-phosphopantetheinyl transferase